MANEIDLYKDLDDLQRLLNRAIKRKDEKAMLLWSGEIKKVTEELYERYPELSFSSKTL